MSARRRIPRSVLVISPLTAALGLLTAAAGCTSATDVEILLDDLDRAEALWLSNRPEGYRARESRVCECLRADAGPVVLEVSVRPGVTPAVESEEIVAATYVEGGGTVPQESLEHFVTVVELFALVRQAAEEDAHGIIVEYDDELGYPRRVEIDWDVRVADEESIYFVELLEPAAY